MKSSSKKDMKVKALKDAIKEGKASGFETDFDTEVYLKELKAAKHV